MNSGLDYLGEFLQVFPGMDAGKINRLVIYLQLVLKKNQQTNLTAITNWEEAVIKHLYDSLMVVRWPFWPTASKILDLGTGAGFPGIPLAILCPQQQYCLVEANKKKAEFLSFIKNELRLDNISVVNDRAENIARQQKYREQYEIVTARAVANTAVLLELAIPLCQKDGYFIAYKGGNYQNELALAQNAIEILDAPLVKEIPYELPNDFGRRCLLIFQKTKTTPDKYPRRPGIPEKRPL